MGTCFYYLLFQLGEFQIANFIVRLLTTAVTFKATSGLLIAFKDKVHKRKISLFYYFCVVKISNESESNFVYSQFSNLSRICPSLLLTGNVLPRYALILLVKYHVKTSLAHLKLTAFLSIKRFGSLPFL